MARLTVRLPGTLHERLAALAEREGVSLNQYIVYALTRQVTGAYTVEPVPEAAVAEQRTAYRALVRRLGCATAAESEAAMAGREPAEIDALAGRVAAQWAEDGQTLESMLQTLREERDRRGR